MDLKTRISCSFNFTYAGCCFVTITVSRKKYVVSSNGFETKEGITFFDYKARNRVSFNTLYEAVAEFNKQVYDLVQSMDWFSMTFFENDDEFRRSGLKELL